MNKIVLFCGVAAMCAMASCSTKSTAEAEAVNAVETEAVEQADVTLAPVATDGKVLELTDAALIAPGVKVSQLTVVDFNAVWCGPCRALTPVLEEMAAKYQGKATFISVDVDKFGELFEAYNLGNSIPAVLILRPDGQSLKYIGTGDLLPASSFEAIIDANL
ncbi:MAG: thioredoxin domain-containing protein [Muribaculaceae bacterium]|nr:thioredoxin domain-containing protein [Muribaculaceae bacterium]